MVKSDGQATGREVHSSVGYGKVFLKGMKPSSLGSLTSLVKKILFSFGQTGELVQPLSKASLMRSSLCPC